MACSTVPPLSNADHFGIWFSVESKLSKQMVVNRTIWRYNQADFDRAAELLETTEWDLIIPQECCDVDAYWLAWKNYFMQVVQMCVPRATDKVKPVYHG